VILLIERSIEDYGLGVFVIMTIAAFVGTKEENLSSLYLTYVYLLPN
jgi:hypothetical protein